MAAGNKIHLSFHGRVIDIMAYFPGNIKVYPFIQSLHPLETGAAGNYRACLVNLLAKSQHPQWVIPLKTNGLYRLICG